MRLPIHQIDAFAERPFEGNPAAVMPLEKWLPDKLMQAIAMENQLSETAFFVPSGNGSDGFDIRWFTPANEVDLCGHATLASAWLVFNELCPGLQSAVFHSQSGRLAVTKDGEWLVLDFPRRPGTPTQEHIPALTKALGVTPVGALLSRDLVAVLETEEQVRALKPDFLAMASLPGFSVLASAPGNSVDFVSRCFFPRDGIPEDPVTGSAHSTLIPYWSERLGKTNMEARQLSQRGGRLRCRDCFDRVHIAGKAVKVMEGVMTVKRNPK
ncbi:MAG: PhzF family phenazine biosynthesis protein [Holophagales bacterium]|jgi:PhzF family phenazine biosynthesis protein|nr:PhzF family phenazine biosynthesis protein [Holophagales bacterium]